MLERARYLLLPLAFFAGAALAVAADENPFGSADPYQAG